MCLLYTKVFKMRYRVADACHNISPEVELVVVVIISSL